MSSRIRRRKPHVKVVTGLAELQKLLPSVSSLDQLAARAFDDGRIPMLFELGGYAIPSIPLLGQLCGVGFGRNADSYLPQPGVRALDRPFLAGQAPVIVITVPEDDGHVINLEELAEMDGLQVAQVPKVGGHGMVAFVGFVGERPIGILAAVEPPVPGWPRLHQIEALANLAGHADFFITNEAILNSAAAEPSAMSPLVHAKVRMRPTVEPDIEYWPSVGTGFCLTPE